jgi:hypothetical protein
MQSYVREVDSSYFSFITSSTTSFTFIYRVHYHWCLEAHKVEKKKSKSDLASIDFDKTSVDLPSSGVELVKMMQVSGDMENSLIMFDHVKRVKDWTLW